MNKTAKIFADTSQRQYPLPQKKWKYFQEWHNTLFLHWKVPAMSLENYIPEGIKLDIIDNMAWVSLVAFEVRNMRLRNLPPIPFLSQFHEINLRTYVIKDGIPGIYFFSIETDKFIEVLLTRIFIGLPYEKSKIQRTLFRLCSDNESSGYHLDVQFNNTPAIIKKAELDFWLTERHALYQNYDDKIYRFDIHHKEWNLKSVNAKIVDIRYQAGLFSPTHFPDKVHFAKKVNVVLWGKIPV